MQAYFKVGIFYLFYAYSSLIFINIILSWFPGIYRFRFFRFLKRITDAYMQPFHGVLILGIFDFTSIIGIFLFDFIVQAYALLLS